MTARASSRRAPAAASTIGDAEFLDSRMRLEHPGAGGSEPGSFVLYWMVHAPRRRENPALAAAARHAASAGLPLLTVQMVPAADWHASDRHAAFVLEGTAELAAAFAADGLAYALYVEPRRAVTPDSPDGALLPLAKRAAAVFAEDFPTGPWPAWRAGLAAAAGCPVFAVDTACVLPMNLVGKAYERAFLFRDQTARRVEDWIGAVTPDVSDSTAGVPPAAFDGELGFVPTEPPADDEALRALLATMEIDHSVGRVFETRGGESAARARWDDFRARRLRRYHLRRNDAADNDGVSNMSPYLARGFVAAWELAREARDTGGEGAEKWLDELLVWRELSYAFCRFRPDHATLAAIPAWARETLADSAAERRRKGRPALDALEIGDTGDPLWNMAQASLVRHGMLHNNIRMTWGKAVAAWFDDPAAGLAETLRLNHRHAIDGRDPNSYGGILWCFGQFDGAKPKTPLLGAVRDRPTDEHLRRVGRDKYSVTVSRPRGGGVGTVLVVGGGLSGLLAASTLQEHGLTVTVLDKGRGPGGRMATRRGDDGAGFDHGAQYFTVRDGRFARVVDGWLDAGIAVKWADGFPRVTESGMVETDTAHGGHPRYRGVGGMAGIAKHLARRLDVRTGVTVERVERDGPAGGWRVWTDDGRSMAADALVMTAPAPQSLVLLNAGGVELAPAVRDGLAAVVYDPCFAVLAELAGPSGLAGAAGSAGGLFVDPDSTAGAVISWMADNTAKGVAEPADGRACVTIHATGEFSRRRFDDAKDDVAADILAAAAPLLGSAVASHSIHRWKFAQPTVFHPEACGFDDSTGAPVAFAGDGFLSAKVEGAALSGMAAAGRLLAIPLMAVPT